VPLSVFAIVISAALLHASWNAIVKSAGDKFLSTIMVSASAAGLSAVLLPFLNAPAQASWPFAAASALLQIAYFLLIARTYDIADMSQTYPLMRGTPPLIVALISVFQVGESLSRVAWIGVLGICAGILSIAMGSGPKNRKGTHLALLNALVIAAYTLVDGAGVRRSGAPAAYTLWIFLLTGLPLAVWAALTKATTLVANFRRHWPLGVAGGMGAISSYGLALWAMTIAPVAVVAALRETSILFGTVIAGLVLKEHVGARRMIAACIIACGAAVLRLA
jgi:drug/metabolite transporter (DMT)-like permease